MIDLFRTSLTAKEIEIASAVLRSGKLVMGYNVEALESELDEYLGHGTSVTCASGTDALIMAIEELVPNKGARIAVPSMTFSATYEAVIRAGFIPVVYDVDPRSLTPTLDNLLEKVRECLEAVIIVHLYGWPAEATRIIADECSKSTIPFIEDAAQAFGASVGKHGDATIYSFYPTKPLGGIGDGGACVFRSLTRAQRARARRNHGRVDGSQVMAGYNSRLDEVNAAVLRRRLVDHNANMAYRRDLAERYDIHGLKKMSPKRGGVASPYVYPVLVENREAVRFALAEIGVQTGVHYDPPVSGLDYVEADCPNAEWAAKRILSLPCHEGVTFADVDKIADAIRRD